MTCGPSHLDLLQQRRWWVNAQRGGEPFQFVGSRIDPTAFDIEKSPALETCAGGELGL